MVMVAFVRYATRQRRYGKILTTIEEILRRLLPYLSATVIVGPTLALRHCAFDGVLLLLCMVPASPVEHCYSIDFEVCRIY